jgi:hypothetical protein
MTLTTRTAVALVLALAATLEVGAQKLQSRTLFIEAVDASGAPVTDLKPADLELTEGNAKRQIVRTELGTAPMRIAFLVDTGAQAEPLINTMRAGLNAFLTAYNGRRRNRTGRHRPSASRGPEANGRVARRSRKPSTACSRTAAPPSCWTASATPTAS